MPRIKTLDGICFASAILLFSFFVVNVGNEWLNHFRLYYWGKTGDAVITQVDSAPNCTVHYLIQTESIQIRDKWTSRKPESCIASSLSGGRIPVTFLEDGSAHIVGNPGPALRSDFNTFLIALGLSIASFFFGRAYLQGVQNFFSFGRR